MKKPCNFKMFCYVINCVFCTDKRTLVNKLKFPRQENISKHIEIPHLPNVLMSIPLNKLPCSLLHGA